MHTHRLQLPKHQHFLDEKRHDPITGDKFQEGDEVVFCAGCNSAFSMDSWHYMGKKHCNQSITLKELPGAMTSLRDLEPEDKDIDPYSPFSDRLLYDNLELSGITLDGRQVIDSSYLYDAPSLLFLIGMLTFMPAYGVYNETESTLWSYVVGGCGALLAILYSYYVYSSSESSVKDFIGLGKKFFYQHERKTHYAKINYLKVRNVLAIYNYSITTTFEINTPDGTFELERVFQGEQTTRMEFFFHLAEIAKHTTVYFCSTEEVDNMTFRRFQREYKGGLRFLEE